MKRLLLIGRSIAPATLVIVAWLAYAKGAGAATNYWIYAQLEPSNPSCVYDVSGNQLFAQATANTGCNVVTPGSASAFAYCGTTEPKTMSVSIGTFGNPIYPPYNGFNAVATSSGSYANAFLPGQGAFQATIPYAPYNGNGVECAGQTIVASGDPTTTP